MPANSWQRYGDALVAVAIILVVAMLVIPIPAALLDLFIAFNLSASLIVLLVAIYTREPLQFGVFPSLLLLTTLFRLALQVTSVRLILLEGDAGSVIRQFGNFVVGGNPVVGFVVFVILVIIQFVVITRGAERVSEVAARFTLDAMPGKQMAIDADLSAGLINDQTARQLRKAIEQEADFYGAMDGAAKFVKGDAIAAIIVAAVNLLGGFVVGMVQQGMSWDQALAHFSLLTVGDGLAAQIPALLISTATGIVVTRAASEGNLGEDMIRQLGQEPRVLLLAAGAMAAMSAVPGMPHLAFAGMAAGLGFVGFRMRRAALPPAPAAAAESATAAGGEKKPENVLSLLPIDPLEIELGYGLLPLADPAQGGELMARIAGVRKQIAIELGLVLPYIRVRDNMALRPNQYVIKLKGIEVGGSELFPDQFLAMDSSGAAEAVPGLPTTEPAFGLPALWVAAADREQAEVAGYTVVDPASVVVTHLGEVIRRHAHELLGRQAVKTLVDTVRENHPALVEELTPKTLSLGEIQHVLSNLLREGLSIRDLVSIFEALADGGAVTHDTETLTEHVRSQLARSISRQLGLRGSVRAITLHPDLEHQLLQAAQSPAGPDPRLVQGLLGNLAHLVADLSQAGPSPVLLASPPIRPVVRKLSERTLPKLVVLSYNEIDPELAVETVGMVSA